MKSVVVEFKDGHFVIGDLRRPPSRGQHGTTNEEIVAVMIGDKLPMDKWDRRTSYRVVLTPSVQVRLNVRILLLLLNGPDPYVIVTQEDTQG